MYEFCQSIIENYDNKNKLKEILLTWRKNRNASKEYIDTQLGENPGLDKFLLFTAFHDDDIELFRFLVNNGVSLDYEYNGYYLFSKMIYPKKLEMLKICIEKGINVNIRDKDGSTLLTWACIEDELPAVKLLIESGADIELPEIEYGCSPLLCAVSNERIEIVKYLLQFNPSLEKEDADGQTVFDLTDNEEILNLLKK